MAAPAAAIAAAPRARTGRLAPGPASTAPASAAPPAAPPFMTELSQAWVSVPPPGGAALAAWPALTPARAPGGQSCHARHSNLASRSGIAQHGVVYTGGKSKIAEHGGDDPQDRDVPILVVLPGLKNGRTIGAPVETTQIAPTILSLLGLNPKELQAVRIEGTKSCPACEGGLRSR